MKAIIEAYKSGTADNIHIDLIRKFLNSKNILFREDDKSLGLFYLNEGMLQIRYINSHDNIMDYSKRFGIQGIHKDTFMNITKENTKKGIRTIYIKDFEIDECNNVPQVGGAVLENYHRKFEVVKSYICGATNNISQRIFARDTEVKIVPNFQLRPFLNTNCFYGYRSANINLGLYMKKDKGELKKNELIMVYTFGHPFYGKGLWDIEVIRVATKLHHQVIGGASKLLKHFLIKYLVLKIGGKEVLTNRIVYYVDADHNTGNSLKTLGFNFVKHSGPGFINMWAVDCKHGKKGQTFMRKPIIHKEIMKMMSEGKIISIPNAGTIVYLLDRNKYEGGKYSIDQLQMNNQQANDRLLRNLLNC